MPDDDLTFRQASELYDRISREGAARNSRARRMRRLQSAAAVVLLVGVAISVSFAIESGGQPKPSTGPHVYLGIRQGPWTPRTSTSYDNGALALSLDDAVAKASFPVLVPNADTVKSATEDLISSAPEAPGDGSAAVADNVIRKVWFAQNQEGSAPGHPREGGGPVWDTVQIEYNYLEISEEEMTPNFDGPRNYRQMISTFSDAKGRLEEVNGAVAYVSPPVIQDGLVVQPGLVEFMKSTIQISVKGYYPVSQLLAIANSLR